MSIENLRLKNADDRNYNQHLYECEAFYTFVSWMLLHDYPQSMLGMYLYYIMPAGGDVQGGSNRRIGQYVRNEWRWVRAGVEICVVNEVR